MENFRWDFSLSIHTVFYGLQDLPQYFIEVSSLIWTPPKKKFISFSNFTVQVLEVGFCTQVLFSAPRKCSLQVPMFYIGVSLFVMCYKITHYQNDAPWHQCAFNMGKVYRTKKVFSSQLFKFLSRNVKSVHNILPQLIFYLTRFRTGTWGRKEHLLLASLWGKFCDVVDSVAFRSH